MEPVDGRCWQHSLGSTPAFDSDGLIRFYGSVTEIKAANPAAVLALLDELDRVRASRDAMLAGHHPQHDDDPTCDCGPGWPCAIVYDAHQRDPEGVEAFYHWEDAITWPCTGDEFCLALGHVLAGQHVESGARA